MNAIVPISTPVDKRQRVFHDPSITFITQLCASVWHVSVAEMQSPTHRRGNLSEARFAAIYIARALTARSYPEIARCVKRDHTTLIYRHREAVKRRRGDPEFRQNLAAIFWIIKRGRWR